MRLLKFGRTKYEHKLTDDGKNEIFVYKVNK